MKPRPEVRCPTCRRKGDWFAGPAGPFCSRRCRLVDLGKWLNEEHRLSEPLRPGHFTELSELESGEGFKPPGGEEKA